MMDLMDWTECKDKFIRAVEIDEERITSIVETILSRMKFIESIKPANENASFIFENYYEVIKELLVALLLKKGMRSKNHQCLFTFFNKEYGYDAEVNLMLQMSYLRNRLDYYGEKINYEYLQQNKKQFMKIINLLKQLIEE